MPTEDEVRTQIDASIQAIGLSATAKKLDINAEVVARVACGGRVRAGTIALAGQRLGVLVASSTTPLALSTVPPPASSSSNPTP